MRPRLRAFQLVLGKVQSSRYQCSGYGIWFFVQGIRGLLLDNGLGRGRLESSKRFIHETDILVLTMRRVAVLLIG